jgi:adenylate kinase
MLNLVIFGPPGAGKGTQAKLISKNKDLFHLSSGELLRKEAKKEDLRQEINSYLESGRLVPNKLIIELVADKIKNKLGKRGIIFDGYPRTLTQAKELDNLFKKNKLEPPVILNLTLEEDVATKRILSRALTSNRSDDKEKIIKQRFKDYHRLTEPVLNYYRERNRLKDIDGSKSIDKVTKEINKVVSSI